MNNPAFSSIGSNHRIILSGKLKRPSKQINSVNLNPISNKKPFLKEYSNAMQQKLQSLKQKISQKKKQKNQQGSCNLQKGLSSNLQNFLKDKTVKKQQKLIHKLTQNQSQANIDFLSQFLQRHNLKLYKNLLIENHIDTLDILAEATQKQLQEIGIPKGHSLKLKVNISKHIKSNDGSNSLKKIKKSHQFRQIRTKDSQRNISFVNQQKNKLKQSKQYVKQQQKQYVKFQSISIGTQIQDVLQQISLLHKPSRSKFCLFCYQSIKVNAKYQQWNSKGKKIQYCSQTCSQKYDQMFKKYQNNLIKAQQQFKRDQRSQKTIKNSNQGKQPQQNDEPQQNDWIGFLQNDEELGNFDFEQYDILKKELQMD